jgi:hypothetical protein
LSFLSIRFIRRIVFTINRERNKGELLPLSEPITQQEVRRVGNDIIDDIAAQVKLFLNPEVIEEADEKAEKLFLEEFEPYHYTDFIPRNAFRAVLHDETLAQYVWRTCKEYKQIWRQRVKVDCFIKHGGHRPQAEFVAEAEKNRLLYETNPGKVWKDYLMVKFGFNGEAVMKPKGRKRTKLDSCLD